MEGDGQGALASLLATGPQDAFMSGAPLKPIFKQYSDFSIDQTTYTFGTAPYLGTRQIFTISPKQVQGQLLKAAYLKLQLPPGLYMDQVGRGILKQVSMYLNEVEIETLYDDWYFIRDQLFLSQDEQQLRSNVLNGTNLYIPLDFTWDEGFPISAAWNQTMYIKIDFAAISDISTSQTGDLLAPPQLVLETINLSQTDAARVPGIMTIRHVYKESVYNVTNQLTNVNMTANFNVSLLIWFLRQQPVQVLRKFDYTYNKTTNVALTNTDIFEYIYIFINNQLITNRLPGKLFRYLEPLIHGTNTPSSELYMYSFGKGLDFTKADSSTSTVNIKFKSAFIKDISLNYTLNMYYYGYINIQFAGGYCSLVSV